MPLVKCTTCQQDVSATAEICPHCGQEQPEKHFRQNPNSWIECPGCHTKNHPTGNNLPCRACGMSLDVLNDKYFKKLIINDTANKLPVRFATTTFMLCCLCFWLFSHAFVSEEMRTRINDGGLIVAVLLLVLLWILSWMAGSLAKGIYLAVHKSDLW